MTDYLEPYRQLVRSIRFAPPVGQHERFNRLVHQPLPVPSVHHDNTRQVTTTSTTIPDGGPTPDPSEHSAALVHAAVSKHTVLPVTYSILENIGDRISRLTASKPKQFRLPIVTPKIPEPDPHWIPPTPSPVIQHLVTDLQTPVETQQISTIVEDESAVIQPEPILDLSPVSTDVVEVENVAEEATEVANLNQTSTDEVESESIIKESTLIEDSSQEIASENIADTSSETDNLNLVEEQTEALSLPSNELKQVEETLSEEEEINTEQNKIEIPKFVKTESAAIANGTSLIVQPETSNVEVTKLDEEKAKSSKNQNVAVSCPECNSSEVRKNGKQKNKQKYLCKDCGRQFVWSVSVEDNVKQDERSSEEAKPTTESLASKAKFAKDKSRNQPKGFGGSKKK